MALLLGPPPTKTQARRLHINVGKVLNRWVIRMQRKQHARDRRVGALNPFHAAELTSFTWTRTLLKAIGNSWKHGMTAAQRTYWAALAAANMVQVQTGAHKFLTGPALWAWWATNIYNQYDPYTRYVVPTDLAPFYDGPNTWNPPSAPSGIYVQGIFGGSISLAFYSDTFLNPYIAPVLMLGWSIPASRKITPGWLRLTSSVSKDDPPTGLLDLAIWPTARTGDTAEMLSHLLRIRVCSDHPNFVPSDFTDFFLPGP